MMFLNLQILLRFNIPNLSSISLGIVFSSTKIMRKTIRTKHYNGGLYVYMYITDYGERNNIQKTYQ